MESWMRHNPFNVLIYEAIVKTCLDVRLERKSYTLLLFTALVYADVST